MKIQDSQALLQPAERTRKVFYVSLAAHAVLIIVPLLIMAVMSLFEPEPPEELTVNLVDDPSVGPVVAAHTTRLPPAPKPEPEVNPPPVPPTPAPPEPELPDVLPVPAPPEPEIGELPTPPRPKKRQQRPERKQEVARKPKKPAAPPNPDRTLRNTRKVGVRTGSQTNKNIPIGRRDAAQRYGEKFSNTPNGGRRNEARYAALLGAFLKVRWSPFVPARAQIGDGKPEVVVFLAISGDGRLLEARIEKPSGNPAMDNAVMRMLESLKNQPFPRSPDGRVWRNRVIFDTSG